MNNANEPETKEASPPDDARDYEGQSLLEYLQKHRQPMTCYPSWEEYEQAMRDERDSWD